MDDKLKASFSYRFVSFRPPDSASCLPFVIGGASQNNPADEYDNLNNQDAARLLIQENYIIGVVCDGCTSTHEAFEQFSHSSNDVGAKLLSYLTVGKVKRLVQANLINDEKMFVRQLSEELLTHLGAMTMLSCGADDTLREQFVFDFLMATIVGFVVTEDKYIVFHSGDGVVGINSEFQTLEDHAGLYLANELLIRMCFMKQNRQVDEGHVKVLKCGQTSELNSILLATDGLMYSVKTCQEEWKEFVNRRPLQTNDGFDRLLPEFRKNIAWKGQHTSLIKDDATFLLLRRVSPSSSDNGGEYDR